MQAITPELQALLKSKFQAGASGFRSRVLVDGVPSLDVGVEDFANQSGGGAAVITIPLTEQPEAGTLLVGFAGAAHTGGTGVGDYYEWPAGWVTIEEAFHPSWASAGSDTLGLSSFAYKVADGTETNVVVTAHVANLQASHALVVNYKVQLVAPYLLDSGRVVPSSPSHTSNPPLPTLTASDEDVLIVNTVQERPNWPIVLPAGYVQRSLGTEFDVTYAILDRVVHGSEGTYGGSLSTPASPQTGSYPDPLWTIDGALFKIVPQLVPGGLAEVPGVLSVSIDKSLQTDADSFEVEFENEDGAKSLYPNGSWIVPTRRCQIWQWYGDEANAVQTFEGFLDKVHEHRSPHTISMTGRDWMKRLLVQDILVTAPQGADEAGAVRTTANFVYLDMEVSDIVLDLLDKANFPTGAARAVQQTSYQVDEYVGSDGNSFADALSELADLVGYNSFTDELGTYHFEADARSQSTDTDTPDAPVYTFRADEDILVIDPEQDDYDLKTRVRVVGPMSTTVLKNSFTELWHTAAVKHPTGVWWDPADPGFIRVADGVTHKVYRVNQTTRKVVSATPALTDHYIGGLSGDPGDSTVYYVLEIPWKDGSGSASQVHTFRKSDNALLDTFNLPSGRWTGMKASSTHLWLSNWDTNKIHKYSKAGSSVASYTIVYNGDTQVDPTAVAVDGTTLYYFFYNTNRVLVASTGAPTTITKRISTAGTHILGGELDTATHTELFACSDSLGLVWKYTLVEPVTTERTVFVEVVNADLEALLDGEVRRLVVRMDAITSLAQATETAQRWLSRLDHNRQALDFGCIGNPAIQKGDMIRIEEPGVGISTDWQVDTYRTEMDADGTYLGVISALPWDPRYN